MNIFFPGLGKPGNFVFSQGNLEKMEQVMEKSGDYKTFQNGCYS